MRRARFLSSVRVDLIAILTCIAEVGGSVATAEAFVSRLRVKCHEFAALSATVGRARPELRADIRSFPCKGYVIFFRYQGEDFEVVNILEGHRDLSAHFSEPGTPCISARGGDPIAALTSGQLAIVSATPSTGVAPKV